MKMMRFKDFNPKKILRSASFSGFSSKSRSVSRSDPQSLSSGSTASSDESLRDGGSGGGGTPNTVLPAAAAAARFSQYELAQALNLVSKGAAFSAADVELILSRSVSDDFDVLVTDDAAAAACASGDPDLKDAFAIFDADGDGKISAEELLHVFAAIGDEGCTLEDCRRMISGVDTDGDGFVCFEDFQRMMMMEQEQSLQQLHR